MSELTVGAVLEERYRIDSVVGRGSFGVVYRATRLADGLAVAVKEMRAQTRDDETLASFVRQFRLETEILRALQHPALPRVYDSFEAGGAQYLVMDFIEGRTFVEVMRSEGTLSEARVLEVGQQLCVVLGYLHGRKPAVIVRDIKPANLICQADGRVVLLDFGIAKLSDPISGGRTATIAHGSFSPGYAAPEQYEGKPTDARTDVFSLGATLFSLLTGQAPPFSFSSQDEQEQARVLAEKRPDLRPALTALIMRMLAQQPQLRPASAAQVGGELRRLAGGGGRWRWLGWLLLLAALLALVLRLAWGQPPLQPFRVLTQPGGARVVVEGSGRFLGLSGQQLQAQPADFDGRTLWLRIERPGYLPGRLHLMDWDLSRNDRSFPEQGVLRLTPRSLAYSVVDAAREHIVALALATLGLVAALVGVLRALPYLRYREAQRRAARIQVVAMSQRDLDPYLGSTLAGWHLVERLGDGGGGAVYRAQSAEGAAAAVKILWPEGAATGEAAARFRREADMLRQLSLPGVVRLLEVGEESGRRFLVTEFVVGNTLRHYMKAQPQMPLAQFEPWFNAMVAAVHAVHERGVTHRDLKPENVMVTDDGTLKVLDFGIARGDLMTAITMEGRQLGTPAYMAPEQFADGRGEASSDQYSLGLIGYEMLAGRLPFKAENVLATMYAHIYATPEPLGKWRADLPPGLEAVIMRMMSRLSGQRFAHLGEVLERLAAG